MARARFITIARRFLKWTSIAITVLLAVGLVCFGLLQTGPGKRVIANTVSNAFSDPELNIQLDGIHGFLPLNFGFRSLTIADGTGTWLRIQDASVHLAITALARKKLQVKSLTAAAVTLDGLPESGRKPWQLPEVPSLPRWIQVDAAHVSTLTLGQDVTRADPASLTITAHYLPLANGDWDIAVNAERVDGIEGVMSARLHRAGSDLAVGLTVNDAELAPGFLGAEGPLVIAVEGDGPAGDWQGDLDAALGVRPLASARLTLDGTENIGVNSAVLVHLDHPLFPEDLSPRLGAELRISADAFLGEDGALDLRLAEVTMDQGSITLAGQSHLDQRTATFRLTANHEDLRRFMDESGNAEPLPASVLAEVEGPFSALQTAITATLQDDQLLTGHGTLDIETGPAAEGQLTIYPPAEFLPQAVHDAFATGVETAFAMRRTDEGGYNIQRAEITHGQTHLQLTAAYNPATPSLEAEALLNIRDAAPYRDLIGAELTGEGELHAVLAADGEQFNLEANVDVPLLALNETQLLLTVFRMNATGQGLLNGELRNLQLGGDGVIAEFVHERPWPEPIHVRFRARSDDLETFQLHGASVEDGNIHLALDGKAQRTPLTFDGTARYTAARLADAAAFFDAVVSGQLDGESTLLYSEDGVLKTESRVILENLGDLPEPLAALLGNRVETRAVLTLDDTAVTVENFRADATHANLTANAVFTRASETLRATTALRVPDLAVLQNAFNTSVSGGFNLAAEIEGPLDGLKATGEANARALRLNTFHTDAVLANFEFEGLPSQPAGNLRVVAQTSGAEARLASHLSLAEDILTLRDLNLASGDNAITGQLAFNLEDQWGEGEFRAEFPDLTRLGAFVDVPISGDGSGDIQLTRRNGTPMLRAAFNFENVQYDAYYAGALAAGVHVSDPLGDPGLEADATVTGARYADWRIADARLESTGNQSRLTYSATISGDYEARIPFRLAASGNASVEMRHVIVESFAGAVDEQSIILASAVELTVRDGQYSLTPLTLQIGDGIFEARGQADDTIVNASATWSSFDLALLAIAGGPAIAGSASGEMTLNGPITAPILDGNVTLADVRSDAAFPTAPALTARASWRLANQSLNAEWATEIPGSGTIEGQAAIPVRLSLSPVEFAVLNEQSASAQLTANLDTKPLPAMAGIDDHRLEGNLQARVDLTGTLAEPSITGAVDLTSGRYENIVTGTIFTAVELNATLEERLLSVARLEIADGAGGTLSGGGTVQLDADTSFPLDFSADLNGLRLIRRDDLRAEATGTVTLTGNTEGLNVGGAITMDRVEVNVADRPPASDLAVIQVTEINRPGPAPAQTGDTAAPLPVALALDIAFPSRTFVRGQGLNTEWQGNLAVSGTADDARLQGGLTAVRGHLDFLGRRFQLAESRVSFAAAQPPTPFLDITAVAETADIIARLRATGEFESLAISFESEPPLPQDEILAHILFGRALSQVSPVQALQLARFAAQFSGRTSGRSLLGGPSRIPGVDMIDLRQGESPTDMTVGVGRYIGDSVYVDIQQGVGGDSTRARVRVELSPNLNVIAEGGATNRNRVGIFWKRDY